MSEEKADKIESVSAQLRTARLEKKLTLKEVELVTKIRGKYLRAIEAGNYGELPQGVFGRGFVQSYGNFLGLDGKALGRQYIEDRGEVKLPSRRRKTEPKKALLTPRLLTLLGSMAVIAVIGGYIVWQFSNLLAPPKLEVANPPGDQVVTGSLINIKGNVGGGSDVFVNDSPILSDANGNFSDDIALEDGVNSIRVTAKSKLGKSITVTRNVLAHVPKLDPSTQPPTSPFDGIAMSIQVKDTTAAVTVVVDGKQAFKGTMLPGTIQNFKGANSITISTSNAGATDLLITNSVVASKSLNPLGDKGESKKNLEFDKDTQFQ